MRFPNRTNRSFHSLMPVEPQFLALHFNEVILCQYCHCVIQFH
uniref:Uncharacterized protein n=1 Tax=Anguilla anguilla TaxID=7936 RepID=A0A0E9VHY4_ANGAN